MLLHVVHVLCHVACSNVSELRQQLQVTEADLKGREESIQRRDAELAAATIREQNLQQQLRVRTACPSSSSMCVYVGGEGGGGGGGGWHENGVCEWR